MARSKNEPKKGVAAAASTAKPAQPAKKKRRRRKIKAEIRQLQTGNRATKLLTTRASFERVVREVLADASEETLYVSPSAVAALQEAAEAALTQAFMRSNRLAVDCGNRVGVTLKDFRASTDTLAHFVKQ